MKIFFNKLVTDIQKTSRLCIGIDPSLEKSIIKKNLHKMYRTNNIVDVLTSWSETILESSKLYSSSVKFQSAYFEAFGTAGIEALKSSISIAKEKNFNVILDAKRSDIGSTMTAYGRALFDQMEADAVTINLYHGTDTLDALLPWIKEGRAIYIVWLTSNPSFRELQNFSDSSGASVYEHALEILRQYTDKHDLKSIGLVLGATNTPLVKHKLYRKLQDFPLLMPGVGFQKADTSQTSFSTLVNLNPSTLVPVSRGLLTGVDLEQLDLAVADIEQQIHRNCQELLKSPVFHV